MQRETPSAWICTALMRIGTRMAAGFDQYFAERGITQAQFRLLLGVYTEGRRHGLPPSELAEHLLIKRSTVSILSNRMVDLGWLERRPGENRRSFHLALTPAGTALLEKVVPMAIYLANITLEGFSTTQLQVMRRDLEQIEGNLRQFKS